MLELYTRLGWGGVDNRVDILRIDSVQISYSNMLHRSLSECSQIHRVPSYQTAKSVGLAIRKNSEMRTLVLYTQW